MIKRVFWVCVLACLRLFFAQAQADTGSRFDDTQQYFPFIRITDDPSIKELSLSDEEFYDRSHSIIFPVNRTELSSDDEFVQLYEETIVPLINHYHLQLKKIYIRGAASPEGPYANNKRLGKGRANTLLRMLQRHLDFQELKVEVSTQSVTEDYGYLCLLMERAQDPDYELVHSIYVNAKGNEAVCKSRLQKAKGGKLWKRLLKEYFPQLRSARFVIWFQDTHFEPTEPSPQIPWITEKIPASPYTQLIETVGVPALVRNNLPMPDFRERRHLLAVRTNLVHDLLYVPQHGFSGGPNIQLEYYPLDGHYTCNAGFTFMNHKNWNTHKFFQVRDLQLELRRYFKGGGEFIGPYLGLYAEGTVYGIGFGPNKGWQGEGGGGGISGGYTCNLNRKGNLRLEFSLSLGAFITRYDPYIYNHPFIGYDDGYYYYDYYGNSSDFLRRNHQFNWFGPTNAGVSLTYDILYRKIR